MEHLLGKQGMNETNWKVCFTFVVFISILGAWIHSRQCSGFTLALCLGIASGSVLRASHFCLRSRRIESRNPRDLEVGQADGTAMEL